MLTKLSEGNYIELSCITQIQTLEPRKSDTAEGWTAAKVIVRWAAAGSVAAYQVIEFEYLKEAIAFADSLFEQVNSAKGK